MNKLLLLLIVSTHKLDIVFQPELNTVFCSVVEYSKICNSTFLLQEGYLKRWSIVCGSEPHSQVTSSFIRYPHFLRFTLQRPVPVLSRFKHFHSVQLESAPGGSSSLAHKDIVIDGGRLASLSFHNVSLMLVVSMGLTALRKLFLDFSRLFPSSWPKRGCRSSVDCMWRSMLLATLHRISDSDLCWN